MSWILALVFFGISLASITVLIVSWQTFITDKTTLQLELDKTRLSYSNLRQRIQGIVNADEEKAKIIKETKDIAEKFNIQIESERSDYKMRKQLMDDELKRIEASLEPLRSELIRLNEGAALAEMGYYKPRYNFATSQQYKTLIEENETKQRETLKAKTAAICSTQWTIDGSIEKGRKLIEKYLNLLVRAFNGECDSAIAKVKSNNYDVMQNRINKSFESLNKLGETQNCLITVDFLNLRLEELRLEFEHALKIQAEREEQRAIKEEIRQQAIAEREIEKAQQQAELEERQFEAALSKARDEFAKANSAKQVEMQAKLLELEKLVAEAQANKERAISRAQQTRSGHVYVISNLGSFGSNIYKIGMTRRLDPMDRIWELSDASVPFDFDVHAIIYTADAPALETELHQRFSNRRVNVINQKKEFFNVTIQEIEKVVRERCGDIELTMLADAAEYLQSEAFHRENGRPMSSNRQFTMLNLQLQN